MPPRAGVRHRQLPRGTCGTVNETRLPRVLSGRVPGFSTPPPPPPKNPQGAREIPTAEACFPVFPWGKSTCGVRIPPGDPLSPQGGGWDARASLRLIRCTLGARMVYPCLRFAACSRAVRQGGRPVTPPPPPPRDRAGSVPVGKLTAPGRRRVLQRVARSEQHTCGEARETGVSRTACRVPPTPSREGWLTARGGFTQKSLKDLRFFFFLKEKCNCV